MPIPPKKEDEFKQPDIISSQSFVFVGLIAAAATSIMISKGGFKMNRNLNVMQRFVSSHSNRLGNLVEHTPSGKNKIFRQNVENIIQTAQKIGEDKIPEKTDTKHVYPKPTFASQTNFHNRSRQLLSSKRNDTDTDTNKDK